MKPWLLLGVVALLAATPAAANPRRAAPLAGPAPSAVKLFMEILVLHGTNANKGIDARIGKMPELSKAPFSSYDSYELVDRARLALEKGAPKTLVLPNGRVLETRLLELLGADRVRLSASINQPGGKEFLPLLEVKAQVGQPFIVAGQRYKSGILVLVFRVVR